MKFRKMLDGAMLRICIIASLSKPSRYPPTSRVLQCFLYIAFFLIVPKTNYPTTRIGILNIFRKNIRTFSEKKSKVNFRTFSKFSEKIFFCKVKFLHEENIFPMSFFLNLIYASSAFQRARSQHLTLPNKKVIADTVLKWLCQSSWLLWYD